MKSLFLVATCLISFNAFSQECKVYGISDSPQSIECTIKRNFRRIKMNISCVKGQYIFKGGLIPEGTVIEGTHGSTENGSTILMFYNDFLRMEIGEGFLSKTRIYLELRDELYKGTCRK